MPEEKNNQIIIYNTKDRETKIKVKVENYQQADRSIVVPKVLRKYMPGSWRL